MSGCDLFAPRTPEPPVAEGGTFEQPDTPDQVVDNVRAAVAELNAQNYRRSFADTFSFTPTSAAEATQPALWAGWGREEEEAYFTTMAEAARNTTGNELRLTDESLSFLSDSRAVLEAGYRLTVFHRRPGVPTTVEGRLLWTIDQGPDGLWRISEWTDRATAGNPSWSALKAEFGI